MALLKTMAQHGPVNFFEKVPSNLDYQIGPDTEDAVVVRRVVDLAQGKAITDRGNPVLVRVRNDMGGIKELCVAQGTHSTSNLVSAQYLSTEHRLMQALAGLTHDVTTELIFNHRAGDDESACDVKVEHEASLLHLFV